jgi:NitT/TauT family transport system substrate-binding protein
VITRRQLIAAGAALPLAASASPLRAQSMALRVGTSPSGSYAEPLFFAPAEPTLHTGLTLDVSLFSSSTATAAAVSAGSLDAGLADPLAIANGVIHGIPFRIIATGAVYTPATATSYVCVAQSSPLKTAKDLNGASLGVVTLQSSISFVMTKAWLAANGADLSTIRFVEMPYATMGPALERGTIAAATMGEPYISELPAGVRIFANPYQANYATSVWFSTEQWLQQNPVAARALPAAVYKVARWANDHPKETAAALAAATHLDVARAEKMRRSFYAPDAQPASIRLALEAGLKFGAISRAVRVEELLAT